MDNEQKYSLVCLKMEEMSEQGLEGTDKYSDLVAECLELKNNIYGEDA